jgi:transcriptional regulator with XRE-family HTH domain
MTIEQAFGEVLRMVREERGLTWDEFMPVAGIKKNGLWKIESGRSGPKLTTLYKLARALEIAPEELIRRTSILYRDNRHEVE